MNEKNMKAHEKKKLIERKGRNAMLIDTRSTVIFRLNTQRLEDAVARKLISGIQVRTIAFLFFQEKKK